MAAARDAAHNVASVVESVVDGAADLVGDAVGAAGAVAGAAAARRRASRVADAVEDAFGTVVEGASDVVGGAVGAARSAARHWDERPGARVRRVRRLGRHPLPYLYAVHPDARQASPREIGLRAIDTDLIAGTAVGGVTQRGGDFLPLRPFRSTNWQGRWSRIRAAADRLTILPPIDVLRYRGRYWVLDGHNRVASALYNGQLEIDANVVELVPPNEGPSERPSDLAAVLTGSQAVRTAGEGHPVGPITEDRIDRPPGPGKRGRRA